MYVFYAVVMTMIYVIDVDVCTNFQSFIRLDMSEYQEKHEVFIHLTVIITSPLQSHLGRATLPPSWQRMDSPTACASCEMPIANESNHSASTLHLDHTDGHTTMAYTMLA